MVTKAEILKHLVLQVKAEAAVLLVRITAKTEVPAEVLNIVLTTVTQQVQVLDIEAEITNHTQVAVAVVLTKEVLTNMVIDKVVTVVEENKTI